MRHMKYKREMRCEILAGKAYLDLAQKLGGSIIMENIKNPRGLLRERHGEVE